MPSTKMFAGVVTVAIFAPFLFVSPAAAADGGPGAPGAPETRTKKSTSAMKVVKRKLKVRAEDNVSYDRALFPHWRTVGGCDTRARVLIAETLVPVAQSSGRCTVLTGAWYSAYDGVTITTAGSADIDHVVALSEAFGSGAKQWTTERRTLFANDTDYAGSLIAVSASSNRSKSDRDPAEWQPTNTAYRCEYIKTWISVKYRWRLTIDLAEKEALKRGVKACQNRKIVLPPRA